MKHHAVSLVALLSFAVAGCGKKDADKAPDPAPTADKPAADKSTTTTTTTKAALPPECKEFTDAIEQLIKCDKLKASSAAMKEGYDKMLKAMADLGDAKASADGCKQGLSGLKQALTSAGC